MQPNWCKEMRAFGWEFRYEPGTRFVGCYHPDGGAMSVCRMEGWNEAGDQAGYAIASMLNGEVDEDTDAQFLTEGEEKCPHNNARLTDIGGGKLVTRCEDCGEEFLTT